MLTSFHEIVEEFTVDYKEPFEGARARLNKALEVIVVTYYATVMKHRAEKLLDRL